MTMNSQLMQILTVIIVLLYFFLTLMSLNSFFVDGKSTPPFQTYKLSSDPDALRNTSELIRSRGFQTEEYNVTTEDGYIINVNRIVDRLSSRDEKKFGISICRRKPVILSHGLFLSADAYLLNTPQLLNNESIYGNNLGFSLMLTGRYDVWLVTVRGSDYSQMHKNQSYVDEGKYWHFTFDQMAQYDIPAVIRLVQQRTGCRKDIGYIGHSQGTTMMFALLSTQPEYGHIISPFIALAPVIYTEHTQSPYRYLSRAMPLLRIRGGQFMMTTQLVNQILINGACLVVSTLCWYGLGIRLGFDHQASLNQTRKELYARWYGASDWNVAHWSQLYMTGRFAKFDFGTNELNKQHYGQSTNPDYDLKNIPKGMKIAIYQSKNDYLSTISDGKRLKRELKENGIDLIDDFIVTDEKFTHLDFMYGKNTGQQYIDRLIFLLDRYNSHLI